MGTANPQAPHRPKKEEFAAAGRRVILKLHQATAGENTGVVLSAAISYLCTLGVHSGISEKRIIRQIRCAYRGVDEFLKSPRALEIMAQKLRDG